MDLADRVKRELERTAEQSKEFRDRRRHYNEQREKIANHAPASEGYKIPLMRRIGHGEPLPRKFQWI